MNTGGVLIVSNEESAEDDIMPRMEAMGADPQRYLVIDDRDGPILLPRDVPLIAEAAQEIDAHLIILDSIMSMLPSTNPHQARCDLHDLRQLARELNAAVVLINHFDKFGRMAMGSTGLLTICRSRLICERDRDFADEPYQFVLRPEKNSKGGAPTALRYETVQNRDTGIITVRWGDTAPNIGTLADMRNAQKKWLEELLLMELASGPKMFGYLCDAIKDIDRSVTPAQLRDARDRLQRQGLIKKWPIHQPGPHRGWWWGRSEHYRHPLPPNTPTQYTRAT